jgi:xanthosine utilization system XapX-like protein
MTALSRMCRWLATAALASLAVLLASGAWLVRHYRPSPSLGTLYRRYPAIAWAIGLHRVAAGTLLLAAGLLVGVRLAVSARRAAPPVLAVVAGVALVFTGRRLSWTQLALRAVKVNLDAGGMLFAAFDDTVRFVIVPGVGEMSPAAFRVLLGLHAVALPLVLVGLLLWERLAQRDRPTAPGT